jgi:hypothetical protein
VEIIYICKIHFKRGKGNVVKTKSHTEEQVVNAKVMLTLCHGNWDKSVRWFQMGQQCVNL